MVNSFTGNISSWIWGSNPSNANTVGSAGNAPVLTEEIKKNEVVKEGVLYKQSRYLK
jgi:hypothetical protein